MVAGVMRTMISCGPCVGKSMMDGCRVKQNRPRQITDSQYLFRISLQRALARVLRWHRCLLIAHPVV